MAQLKFSNRIGFPNLEATGVSSDGTNTTVTFNSHPFVLTGSFFGGFWIKISQAVTTSTEPLQFTTSGVSGSTVPVYLASGTQATVADIASTGPAIYLAFYDRDNNRVQLIK
jgi:hypothetical protein